jgi:acyl dehydratase
MMRPALAGLLTSLLLCACGGQVVGDPGPSVEPGHLTLVAAPDRLSPGGTVHATVTVTGPAEYEAGCVQTVRLWVLDAQNQRAWTEPAPEVTCMAIINKQLPAGQTATFQVDWPVAATLHPGRYTIHGLFLFTLAMGAATRVSENLPPAEVWLQ